VLPAPPDPAPGSRLALLTREGCHLCVVAAETLSRVGGEAGLVPALVDVDTDPELRAEYGDRVPVIMIDGREHGYWAVEEDRFRAALGRRRADH
jgi:glutaredoxin